MRQEKWIVRARDGWRQQTAVTLALVLIFLVTPAVALAGSSLPELFREGQQQFKSGRYQKSLETFEKLDKESQKPGFERDRQQLQAPLHFFRAANLAMLKRHDEAVTEFQQYLQLNPQAALQAGSFPHPVLKAFEDARKAAPSAESQAQASYDAFKQSEAGTAQQQSQISADWDKSAVRFLMTDEEKEAWKQATTAAERAEFVKGFWKKRDPTPETEANELRDEFNARLRYADKQWTTEDMPGRDSDRGAVLALLGPPSIAGTSNVSTSESAIETLRSRSRGGPQSIGTLQSNLEQGRREVWTYRKDRCPDYLKMRELTFEFLTRKGYGEGVLDRSSRSLYVLGEIARHINATGELN